MFQKRHVDFAGSGIIIRNANETRTIDKRIHKQQVPVALNRQKTRMDVGAPKNRTNTTVRWEDNNARRNGTRRHRN